MKLSIGKKLTLLIGILLFLGLVLGIAAYNGVGTINTELKQVINVEQPTSAVAYEMDLHLLRTGFSVLGYLQDQEQSHLSRIQDARANFERLHQEYVQLAETDRGQSLGAQAEELFGQFEVMANRMIAVHDHQRQLFEQFHDKHDRLDALIDDQLQAMIETQNAQDYQKLEAALEMEINVHEISGEVGHYLHLPDAGHQDQLEDAIAEFDRFVARFKQFDLSTEEEQWIQELRQLFDEEIELARQIIALEDENMDRLTQFIELRRTLGNEVLFQGIIREIAEKDLFNSEQRALTAVKNTNRLIWMILLGGGVFGLVFGILLSRSITVPMQNVVAAASQLARGDLSADIRVRSRDELGVLARSFRTMIAYIRKVADVTEAIAEGDLQVDVQPQSERDVLNISLQKMTGYIQDVSSITEKIAEKDLAVTVQPKSEQDVLNHSLQKMVTNLQAMIREIEESNWLQNGLNQLNNELLGEELLLEVCNKAVRFVSHYVKAGYGVIYVYDEEQQMLSLYSSFAFTERDRATSQYRLGEGVIGQVALEKTPILLKNIARPDALIRTGTTTKAPLNTYTLPLIYDRDLYGVLELASFEPFDEARQQFLHEATRAIATGIFSAKQRERVQELLQISQQAQQEAERAAAEAEQAENEAQQKANEVQIANARLEEQQQKLQQQSEELQQVNAHLKAQQEQLHQKSEELQEQNQNLNQAKQDLDQRAKDLELASKYKSEFLANMSHELRTPLNSIILLSKMLSKNDRQHLDDKETRQVSVIHQAGQELLRLINDILDLSKIEAGKVTVHPVDFTSSSLLDTFRDLFHSIAEEKELEFVIRDTWNAPLHTDRDKLSQIIRNLLANAFKFTKQGTVSLLVSPAPDRDNLIRVAVADTGIGIPAAKQKAVFEAFQQADGSTSREFGGTGLGLSISREYAKLLGGALELESEEGVGTTFTVTIPAVYQGEVGTTTEPSAAPSPAAGADQAGTKQDSSISAPANVLKQQQAADRKPSAPRIEDDRNTITAGDKTVLIIEDNAELAQVTLEVTRKMGFKVLVGLTGRAGLDLAARFRPTGILLDLVLPDMNGMEILRDLKSTRELRHIPVHIMSSKERNNSFRQAGAIGYYQKPVNDLDIQHAIENLMSVSEKSPKELLIVEDDPGQLEALRDWLSDNNALAITGVSSKDDALEAIEHGSYDAAIIDLGLQDGSGHDICKFIKANNILLPVIIYTGRELTEDEEHELRKYTDSIIIKTARSYERLSDEVSMFLHQMAPGKAEEAEAAAPAPARPLEPNGGDLTGKKILIVDDDVKNVFVLASALENNGAAILDAQNGQAALDLLHEQPDVDLVLMDIMMPVMDGYTAIRQIRKDPQLQHLPIIALTAKALKGDRQKCIQAGADDYLSKPVDYDGLIRLAKAWIEKG